MEIAWVNLEVPIDSLPKVEDVQFQRHPVRYKTYRYLIATFWTIIPTLALSVFTAIVQEWWPVAGVAVFLIFSTFAFIAIHKGYQRRSYALRQRDLSYRKGWIFTSITTVPFNRIQHTEVSQGPLERKFKLCTLNVYTAGGSTSDLSIPGLEADEAAQLRDYIAQKAALYA